jgi:predicted glutamine amidotransferase/SAM-dependent methyltransferase
MCQLLGMNCATPTDFNFSFRGFCRRGGETDKHSHGWGMAIYEGNGLRTFLDSQPAAHSKIAAFVENYPIQTLNMMAHIRYATQGEVSLENVHPFQREMWGIQWCFAHNGEVPKYSDRQAYAEYALLGRSQRAQIFYHPVGNTDSEATFCAILNALRAEFTELPTLPLLYQTLQRLCAQIIEGDEEGTILNFLLGCGPYTQFAYSWPGARPGSKVWNGLHYTVRAPPFAKAIKLTDVDYAVDFTECTSSLDRVAVIATAPLTDEDWKEFKRGELLMFDNGLAYSELYDCQEVETQGRGLFSRVMGRSNDCPEASPRQYDTPAQLRTLVDEEIGARCTTDKLSSSATTPIAWAKKGADLGCGAGCSGIAFRSCVEHMVGVDLSPEMVDKARQRDCYNELVVGNVECVLRQHPKEGKRCVNATHGALASQKFDLIFACNVFVYIMDLRNVFYDIRQILNDGGIFAFSAEFFEQEAEGKDVKPYALQSCARYAHTRTYLEQSAKEFGFETKAFQTWSLQRKHNGRDVYGALVVLTV